MRRMTIPFAALAAVLATLGGCGGDVDDTVAPEPTPKPVLLDLDGPSAEPATPGEYAVPQPPVVVAHGEGQGAPAVAADEVTLEPVDLAGFRTAVAAHKGQWVMVDVWATWCVPCLKKLPAFVALAEELGDDAVLMTLAVDADDAAGPEKTLRRMSATTPNLLLTTPLAEAAEALTFDGGVPQYLLFRPDGTAVSPTNDYDAAVESLREGLASGSP